MESRDQPTTPASSRDSAGGAQHPPHVAATTFKALEPADPLYPCSIMAELILHACYQIKPPSC